MLSNTKTRWSFALATLTFGFLVPQGFAQGVVHHHGGVRCNSGHCGSPLAGPCVPQRMTYGYVPTSWRRWPTDHLAAGPLPEQVPTPAKVPGSQAKPDELPVPTDPSPSDTSPKQPVEPSPLTPPFGSESPTPPFGNEPQAPPFGEEPQTSPPAADPLAVPPSDEPPAPPADASETPPAATSGTTEAAPTPESAPATDGSSPPSFDSEGPPTLPTDDPFKDDPESSMEPKSGEGARLEQSYQAASQRLAAMRAPENARVVASEPRLLRADGGNLEVNRLPEAPTEANPLRQVSHPVRKTSSAVELPSPTVISSGREQGVWRRNPLRSN